jgi:hypothetical protein
MRTRYGKECTYYYEDFRRGRELQECRLLGKESGWESPLCKDCPVPGILLANACPDMVLRGKIASGFLGMGRKVEISTFCRRSDEAGFDPHTGCSKCHSIVREILPPS